MHTGRASGCPSDEIITISIDQDAVKGTFLLLLKISPLVFTLLSKSGVGDSLVKPLAVSLGYCNMWLTASHAC